jgi:hypothetical protein
MNITMKSNVYTIYRTQTPSTFLTVSETNYHSYHVQTDAVVAHLSLELVPVLHIVTLPEAEAVLQTVAKVAVQIHTAQPAAVDTVQSVD